MLENKLTETLKTFNKYELNSFRKYVISPFFNENEQLVALLDALLPDLKKYNEIKCSKEACWKAIFPKNKYNDTKFRRLNSDLLKIAEGFLAYKVFTNDPIKVQNALLIAINEKDIDKLHSSAYRTARRLQEKLNYRNADYYFNQFVLESEYNKYLEKNLSRSDNVNIEATVNNLDYFYLSEKLRSYCELLNYKNIVKIKYDPLFIDEILEHLEKNSYDHVPIISIYYQILLTLKENENEHHYYKLKNLLTQHSTKFPNEEARVLYVFAQNYCIKKINSSQIQFLNELLDLYKELIETGILFKNDQLSPWSFKNIVTIALRLREYTWTEQFIKKYKTHLPSDFQENAVTFNIAKLYFYQQKYDQVIPLLLEVRYQDVFYLLDSKALLLKTYYELDEDEALYSLTESFKVLLNRKKIVSDFNRKIYLNLIKYTKKLMTINSNDSTHLESLKKDLKNEKKVADVNWLIEKIEELAN